MMKESKEYQVESWRDWVRPLEEEVQTEEAEDQDPHGGGRKEVVLEGYYIVFDKKAVLLPADLTATPKSS